MRCRWLVGLIFVSACGGSTQPQVSEPVVLGGGSSVHAGSSVATDDAAPAAPAEPMACPDSVSDAEALTAYRAALDIEAAIEDGSADRDATRERRYQLYDRAADGFQLEALERAGAMKFSIMFMGEAPNPGQRDDYIRALARLVVAARRGNERAARFMPGMDSLVFGRVPSSLEPPLAELPRDWVLSAIATAKAWIDCRAAAHAG